VAPWAVAAAELNSAPLDAVGMNLVLAAAVAVQAAGGAQGTRKDRRAFQQQGRPPHGWSGSDGRQLWLLMFKGGNAGNPAGTPTAQADGLRDALISMRGSNGLGWSGGGDDVLSASGVSASIHNGRGCCHGISSQTLPVH